MPYAQLTADEIFFHCVEKSRNFFPLCGKNRPFFPHRGKLFSTPWKTRPGLLPLSRPPRRTP